MAVNVTVSEGAVAAAVVKVHVLATTVLPAESFAPLTFAVYCVAGLRFAAGSNVAVLLLRVTAASTGVVDVPSASVKVVLLTDVESMDSENVAVTFPVTAASDAFSAGVTEVTVGAVVSPGGGVPVPDPSWSTSFGGVVVSLEPKSAPSLLVAFMPSDRRPPSSPCRAEAVSVTS
jgi:hypothetical protein